MENNIDRREWAVFWRWVGGNTGAHHIGPYVTQLYGNPGNINTRRDMISVDFFRKNKERILRNPPRCSCGPGTFASQHKNNCEVYKFGQYALSIDV
jgi:ribosomal protein S27AE